MSKRVGEKRKERGGEERKRYKQIRWKSTDQKEKEEETDRERKSERQGEMKTEQLFSKVFYKNKS